MAKIWTSACSTCTRACIEGERTGRRRGWRYPSRDTTACCTGRQDRPEGSCGCDPDTDLRGGVPWLRVPAGPRDALDALAYGIERRKVNWIVDADIRAYFDTIPRDWLITFLKYRIGDRRVLIRKWLNAGVMERHRCRDAAGRDCQPLRTYSCTTCLICGSTRRPKVPDGQAIIVRDDIVVRFQHKRDAEQYLRDVRERPLRSRPAPGQDSSCRVRPVRHGELPEARVRLPGLQALLHEDPDRTVQARSQNGSQGP